MGQMYVLPFFEGLQTIGCVRRVSSRLFGAQKNNLRRLWPSEKMEIKY